MVVVAYPVMQVPGRLALEDDSEVGEVVLARYVVFIASPF